MTAVARVLVDSAVPLPAAGRSQTQVDGSPQGYDYLVPEHLAGLLRPGHLVSIQFGARTIQGVVLELCGSTQQADLKPILTLADPLPVLTEAQLVLLSWLSAKTYATPGSLLALFLPPGLAQHADTLYTPAVSERRSAQDPAPSSITGRLLSVFAGRKSLRGRQLDKLLPRLDWRPAARALLRRGILSAQSVLPPPSVRPKYVRTAQLGVTPRDARYVPDSTRLAESTLARRQAALDFLAQHYEQAVDLQWVYASSGCSLLDLRELADDGLVVLREREVWRDPVVSSENMAALAQAVRRTGAVELTGQQESAWRVILSRLDAGSGEPILLHGVTGSGKTELYLRAAVRCIQAGKQVIVLVPEIAMTPQMVARFHARFPGRVGLLHSRLTDGEIYDTWRRARAGLLSVIIGPRSALFAPLPQLGLMVIDECHDSSLHQSEPPFYDAVQVARQLSSVSGALLLMGSATPGAAQAYEADRTGSRLRLTERVGAGGAKGVLPAVRVVDMRAELREGNRGIFSLPLQEALASALARKEQSILFLNRRGTATYVFCRECGSALHCPNCEGPLILHIETGTKLMCHRCGYRSEAVRECPTCGSDDIRAYGLGTERVEQEIGKWQPSARVLRWDLDSARAKDGHALILRHFADGKADVLVGTQMISKGLDLPRVSLVGIVLADLGLELPDPFGAERIFQNLTQVAGRAGRSGTHGEVILQTYQPEHPVVRAAAAQDVDGFIASELRGRLALGLPPYGRLVRMEFRHPAAKTAEKAAHALADSVRSRIAAIGAGDSLIGPAPAFRQRVGHKQCWQLVLRSADPDRVLADLDLKNWRVDVDPVTLL